MITLWKQISLYTFEYTFILIILEKIWGWHIVIDMVLLITAAWFAFHFLTDKSWATAVSVNQFQAVMALVVLHSLGLCIYSMITLWRRKFLKGVMLLLRAILLLVTVGVLMSAFLMAGMR